MRTVSVAPARLPGDADTTATRSPLRASPAVPRGLHARGADRRRRRRSTAANGCTPHTSHRRPSTSGCDGDAGDRHRGPERGHAARGRAALRRAHDRGDAEILGGLHRRVRDRPRDPVVVEGRGRALRGRARARPRFGGFRDLAHRAHGVGRVLADRGLLREHRARRCRRAPRWRRRSPRRASAAASGSSTRASASR